ncbi:uncharacterized protein LOC132737660 isoform X2 [Ruditapes philippinarum]|uniref:uncharacterized protein LOC132737660 isoform X2 n=1 Tax=Ruditapes philippinarum TaxID=129788 RepID=UPI00295C31C9|nr:uncharacterized protein LOC132737660 isoform X2 [Ruditapes philippinarum]
MAPNNAVNSFLLMLLLLPFSFCYVGSGTMTLIQRMETLEKRDKEKSIVIDRLTKQLADQERKIQVMDQTIENIMKDAAKFSYTQQEKYKRYTKLQHDLMLTSGTELYAQITKNGLPLAKAFGLGNSVMDAQGSVTVTAQMNLGDEVWVKHIYPADGSLWGERLTSFTGVLISNN